MDSFHDLTIICWKAILTSDLNADVVITPNPTGSTGYGQPFTDAIQNSWGRLPYQDLVNGFEYIKESMDYVDTDRAVALGASYGGYMMNWIQGHSLGKEFKGKCICNLGILLSVC